MLNLDTHILLYALNDQLNTRERKLLRRHQWAISAIVLWELSKLVSLERVILDLDSIQVSRLFGQLQIIPLDFAICRTSTKLDFVSDPADELIAATSVVYKIPLLTRDKRITKSKVVPLA